MLAAAPILKVATVVVVVAPIQPMIPAAGTTTAVVSTAATPATNIPAPKPARVPAPTPSWISFSNSFWWHLLTLVCHCLQQSPSGVSTKRGTSMGCDVDFCRNSKPYSKVGQLRVLDQDFINLGTCPLTQRPGGYFTLYINLVRVDTHFGPFCSSAVDSIRVVTPRAANVCLVCDTNPLRIELYLEYGSFAIATLSCKTLGLWIIVSRIHALAKHATRRRLQTTKHDLHDILVRSAMEGYMVIDKFLNRTSQAACDGISSCQATKGDVGQVVYLILELILILAVGDGNMAHRFAARSRSSWMPIPLLLEPSG